MSHGNQTWRGKSLIIQTDKIILVSEPVIQVCYWLFYALFVLIVKVKEQLIFCRVFCDRLGPRSLFVCLLSSRLQSGASSQAKHGGAYFSAVSGSIKDPIGICNFPTKIIFPNYNKGFVQSLRCIFPNCKIYLSQFLTVFVQIVQIVFGQIMKMHLAKFPILFG